MSKRLEEGYAEWLDDLYGYVTIAGVAYSTSQALKEVDPIRFRTGATDWVMSDFQEWLKEENA